MGKKLLDLTRFCNYCGRPTIDLMRLSKDELGNIVGKALGMKPDGINVNNEKYWSIGGIATKTKLIEIYNAVNRLKNKEK